MINYSERELAIGEPFHSARSPTRPEIPSVPSFSANGLVLSAGGDHLMVWSVDPAEWRAVVAGRDLTSDEWTTS